MFDSLQNKVFIITGAAGNLGSATVQVFQAAGAKLALLGHNADRLQTAFDTLDDALLIGGVDVTDHTAAEAAIQQVADHFGGIDGLVNTVGGYRAGQPVHETDLKTWDFLMTLNAKSVFLMSGLVTPIMIEQGTGGVILNIGATNGLEGGKDSAAYSASKAAVFRLTESMAKELRPHKIRVNAVYPTIIDTPANREAMPNADFSQWVQPSSIGGVLAFLASDQARDITGALLPIQGV